MSTNARIGHGFTLGRDDGASGFTTVAEVKGIGGISLSADSLDVTHTDSPNGVREFIPGLRDAGEITFDVNWDPAAATHGEAAAGLYADWKGGVKGPWRFAYPGGTKTYTFDAFITGLDIGVEIGDPMAGSVTLKIAGDITVA